MRILQESDFAEFVRLMRQMLSLAETKHRSNDDVLRRARGLLLRLKLGRDNADVELDDDEFYEFVYLAGVFHQITAGWHPDGARFGKLLDLLASERDLGASKRTVLDADVDG